MDTFNVQREDLGDLKLKLTITVPPEEVKAAYDKSYGDIKNKVRVNGFRKGKMPQTLLEKRFSKYMKEEAMETLVPQYYEKAVAKESIAPAIQPEFADLEVEKGKPFVFTATLEVWPEFSLLEPKDFKLDVKEVTISDDERKVRRDHHLGQSAELSDKDGPAAAGDQVTVDFKGKTEDGEEVNQEGFKVVLGNGQLIEAFESAILGLSKGESKEFETTLPEDHPEDRFKGKKASFEVTVQEVQARVLPAIDEKFLERFGDKVNTEAEFDQMVEDELKEIKEREQSHHYREELRKQIVEKLDFQLPASLQASEVEFRVHQLKNQPENADKSEEDLKPQAQKEADGYLRLNRFVHRYMDEKELKPDDNNIWQRFGMQCQMMGQNPMELIRTDYGRQFYNDIYQTTAEEMVLDQLVAEILK
ncbi:MAG: trigger factor [bacterium]|nr:trigger factor [bacterium]